MRFDQQTVIVTGGSRGIGLEIARAFAAEGATVITTGRRAEELAASARLLSAEQPGTVRGIVADATDVEATTRVLEAALDVRGRVDVLVNNVGSFVRTPLLQLERETLLQALDANLTSVLNTSRVIGEKMVEQQSGAIVTVSSVCAHGAEPNTSAYSASKAAVLALSRALALELGPHGVRSNSVSPTYVETDRVASQPAAVRDWLTRGFDRAPMRRIPTAREVAAACVFLASQEASGVSGIDLAVDCGQSAYLYMDATIPSAAARSGA